MITASKYHIPKLALGIFSIVTAASSTMATLNYDLRATALNGVALTAAQAKVVNVSANDVVTFTVYAQVTGTAGDPAIEGFQTSFFSLLSSTAAGQTQGAFILGTVLPAFATGAFNGGTPSDTNADGVNDRLGGQRVISAQSTAPFDITVRSGSTPSYSGTPILDGQEFALMTATFRINVASQTGGSVNVAPSIFTSGVGAARFSATWGENTAGGVTTANRVSGFNGLNPGANAANTGTITVGQGVTLINVPEPSAFGMVLLGAMGLVGFRRFGFSKSC